jgi:hypothetical protein
MNRRTFLTSASVALGAGVAGCNSLTGGNEQNSSNSTGTGDGSGATPTAKLTTVGGEASFARLRIGGPSNVTVGDTFNLPVSVANVGGRDGTFSGRLVITEARQDLNQSVVIESVKPSETGETVVESVNFTNADTYTFAIKGTDATKTVTVEPITKQLGGSFTLENGLRVTVRNVAFQPAVFYTAEVSTGVFSKPTTVTRLLPAASDSILAIIRVALENTGTSPVTFGTDTLQVPQGKFYTQFESGIGLSAAKNITGTPLTGVEVAAAEQKQGWMLAQLPRSVASKSLGVRYQRDSTGTPPEVKWMVSPKSGSTRPLPQFTLKTFKTPKTAEVGRKQPVTVGVTNKGKAAGRFRGVVQYRLSETEGWQSGTALSGNIKPGETKRFTPPIQYPYTDILDFRLQPFGETRTVEFTPATHRFGKSYTTPSGVKITVSDIRQSNSYETDDYGTERTKATAKNHFIFAHVRTEVIEQDVNTVTDDQFTFVHGSENYSDIQIFSTSSKIISPVKGYYFFDSNSEQGTVISAWLIFSVPAEYTANDAVIRWSNTDGAIAEWRHRPGRSGSSNATNSLNSTSGSR